MVTIVEIKAKSDTHHTAIACPNISGSSLKYLQEMHREADSEDIHFVAFE